MPYYRLISPFVPLCLLAVAACSYSSVTQDFVDGVAEHLDVQFRVLDNIHKPMLIEIILRNNGSSSITNGPWAIYFSYIQFLRPSINSATDQMVIVQFKGHLYKMYSSAHFKTIFPGSQINLKFESEVPSVSKTDIMPNWFIAAENCQAKVIKSTAGEDHHFVGGFRTKNSWKRSDADSTNPYSPIERYSLNVDAADHTAAKTHIIPSPKEFSVNKTSPVLLISDYEWNVQSDGGLEFEREYLTAFLKRIGIGISGTTTHKIHLRQDSYSLSVAESYELHVDSVKKNIEIVGADAAGVFYGVQSLISLLSANPSLVSIKVKDAPRYKYRGVNLDVARNFHSAQDVKLLLETMGMYKLNKLHLHLTDDEGWRIEIKDLPELTEIGGKRCFDLSESMCLMTALGSTPDASHPGSGFYSASVYRDILRFAANRHIEVIPEIDSPGHARASILAMKARYRDRSTKGETEKAEKFLLTDLLDTSKYNTVSGYHDNTLNPCLSSTYTFIAHVVWVIKNLHKDVNPLKTFHFGGDEAPRDAWKRSPACKGFSLKNLKRDFAIQTGKIVYEAGVNFGGWEDGLVHTDSPINRAMFNNSDVYAYAWQNLWRSDTFARAHLFANADYKTVMSQATHLYFDHPYEPDPEEPGLTWATRHISTRKVFGFQPDDLFANADVDINGKPLAAGELCGPGGVKCVKLNKPENIIGMECHLWSETVRTADRMNFMLFPRLLAAAERAWHKSKWEERNTFNKNELLNEDWKQFVSTVGFKELNRLENMGIKYRVPPPGAIVRNGRLFVNVEIPGLTVEHSLDKQNTWQLVDDYTSVPKNTIVYLRTRSHDGKRYSRVVSLQTHGREPDENVFLQDSRGGMEAKNSAHFVPSMDGAETPFLLLYSTTIMLIAVVITASIFIFRRGLVIKVCGHRIVIGGKVVKRMRPR